MPQLDQKAADALWNSVINGTLQKPLQSRAASRAKNTTYLQVMSQLGRLSQQTVSSPWRAIALILPIHEHQCSCGHTYRSPAGEQPLVRFIHKKTGALHEASNHPVRFNPHLPREIRILPRKVPHCHQCFLSRSSDSPVQLDLFADFDNWKPFQHQLAIPVPQDHTHGPRPRTERLPTIYIDRPLSQPINAHYLPLCTTTQEPKS